MRIFDQYLFKNLVIATIFITITLVCLVFLTQSMRFLEILINAGTAASAFWTMAALTLPRFFEFILPISLMAAILFLYNKLILDSEIIAMRAVGHAPLSFAKPALILGLILCAFLWVITFWIAPKSANQMHKMRLELTAQLSSVLFHEGIFNPLGKGLTVYIREKTKDGGLAGIMIHDSRNTEKPPTIVLAKRGMIISSDKGQQVIVYDGARHDYDTQSGNLQKLAFDRYIIDLPENDVIPQRWQQPEERTLNELLHPDPTNQRDMESLRDFHIEIHKRITAPILTLVFALIALNALLMGEVNRRGAAIKIILAVLGIVILQSLFITAANMARQSDIGIFLMYALTILPCAAGYIRLTGFSLSSTQAPQKYDGEAPA